MFASVRRYAGAVLLCLQEAVIVFREIRDALAGEGSQALRLRVDELERGRALWEAEVEGVLAKAQMSFRNARNAEERTRHMTRELTPESDEDGADELEAELGKVLRLRDETRGGEEGVSPVRSGVERGRAGRKTAAQRYKFGG